MEKQWAKDINRHFIEKKNMNIQGKKIHIGSQIKTNNNSLAVTQLLAKMWINENLHILMVEVILVQSLWKSILHCLVYIKIAYPKPTTLSPQ